MNNYNEQNYGYQNAPESFFDGSTLGYIGYMLLAFLAAIASMFTLGFAMSAYQCSYLKWYYGHTVICGQRLQFQGRAGSLWGNIIIWMLLTFVTIGIYGLFVPVKEMKWVTKHVTFQ